MQNYYYPKGTILTIKPIEKISFTGIKMQDRKMIKQTLPKMKADYLFCIKRIDESHLLCACAYIERKKNSIKIENDYRDILYLVYDELLSVHVSFVKKSYISFDYVCPIADQLCENNQKLMKDKESKRKAAIREKNREKRSEARRRAYIRLHGDPDDPRNNTEEGIVKLNRYEKRTKSVYKSYCTDWWNVNHPVSAGRGNF